ncbi:MAG: hypothetical protein ABIL11_03355 [Chloroflexota bacterium]
MFKSFMWMAAVVSIVTLNGCGAMPETPNIGVQEQPEVYYIHEDELIRQQLGQKPEALLTLPDMGEVRDALKIEETIFILRERGLQKVSVADKSIDLVAQFPEAISRGLLSAAANHEMLIYSVDERVEIYHLGRQTTSEVFSEPGFGFFAPLGLSTDGEVLYLVPVSGDPEFPNICLVNLPNGEVTVISIGIGLGAALSPNSRYLATTAIRTHPTPSFVGELQYGINLFDLLSEPPPEYEWDQFEVLFEPPTGAILTLPHSPSHPVGLEWSFDSQWVYFLLRPGKPWEEPTTSYGLWRLDVELETFSQVAEIDNPAMRLVGITPDGEWVLLRPEVEGSIDLVHIPTGKSETMLLPPEPIVLVRWR